MIDLAPRPHYLIGCQEPTHAWPPPGDCPGSDEFATKAILFLRWCGLTLYPWQELYVWDALHTGETGLWSFREQLLMVARQNGKGEILVAIELVLIYLCGARKIMHSAHFLDTAMDARDRLMEVIEDHPGLMSWWEDEHEGVPRAKLGNGKDAIEFPNGAKIYFRTRTKKTGRGLAFDCVIFDECFDLPNEVYAAMNNTTKARPNALKIFASSPVNIKEHFHGAVMSAKWWAGHDKTAGLLFRAWCKELDDDPFALDTWIKSNPSLVNEPRPGLQLSQVEDEAASAKNSSALLDAFLVETLGQGDWVPRDNDTTTDFVPIIDYESWNSAAVHMPSKVGDMCVAQDVTPDGEKMSMVAAAWSGNNVFLSLSPLTDFARDDAVESVARAVDNNDPLAVVLDPSGQCSTLVEPLRKADIEPELLTGAKVSQSYELFLRMWAEGRITHDGNPRWLEALKIAKQRDKNGRFRSLERYTGDVTCLVAGSMAIWGLVEYGIPDNVDVEKKTGFVGHAQPVAAAPIAARSIATMNF